MSRAALWIACVIALAACSILTDFDGYVNEGSPATDGALDAEAPLDAHGDSEADGAVARYCTSLLPPPAFCDDFDGVDAGSALSERSRAEAREDDFVSPPRSLRITVDPLDKGDTSAAFSAPLSTSPHRLRCRFHLKVEATDETTSVVQFRFVAGTKEALLELQVRAHDVGVAEYLSYGDGGSTFLLHDTTPMEWPSEWMHVEVVWTDTFSSSLVINGATLETNVPLHPNWFKGLATVFYGNAFANGITTTQRRMRIDNVVIDVE